MPRWWGRGPTTGLVGPFVNTDFSRISGHSHEAGRTTPFPSALSFCFLPCHLASKSPIHWSSLLLLDVPVCANRGLIFHLRQTSWYWMDQWGQVYGEGGHHCLPDQMDLELRYA